MCKMFTRCYPDCWTTSISPDSQRPSLGLPRLCGVLWFVGYCDIFEWILLKKYFEFSVKFNRTFFLSVQLSACHHWSRQHHIRHTYVLCGVGPGNSLAANTRQAITRTNLTYAVPLWNNLLNYSNFSVPGPPNCHNLEPGRNECNNRHLQQ